MTKRTKTDGTTTDQEPAAPSIEDRVADATRRYLGDVEQLMSPELEKRMRWSPTTLAAVSGPVLIDLSRALRRKVNLPPRPPLLYNPPPKTHPPAGSQQIADPQTGSVRRRQ